MATNTSDFFTCSKTAGTAKNLQKPTDGGDNNLWGGYINVDLDTIVGAVNATSDLRADANQNELVDFTATGSAVNLVGITNAATGNGPTIEAKGDDSNVDLNVKPKGTGAILLKDSDGNEVVKTSRTASAVNEVTVANAATGNGPTLSATGDDTNIDLNIAGKGSGTAKFTSNIIIPDAGNIGSVSDPDAIAISSDGGLTFNGGIDNAGTISGGTIGGNVVFPTGQILQVKQSYKTTETTISNNSYTSTGLSVPLTGSATADSTFIILATFTIGEVSGTTAGFSFRISRAGSALANTNTDFISKVQALNGGSITDSIALSAKEAPTSTNGTTYTYQVDFKRTTAGAGSAVINPSVNMSTITVFEVAGQST